MPPAKTHWTESIDVRPGEHVLVVLTSEDDVDVLASYAAHGLRRGDPCALMVGARGEPELRARLEELGVAGAAGDRLLTTVDPAAVALRDGVFDSDAMLEQLDGLGRRAAEESRSHVRAASAMSWVDDLGVEAAQALSLEVRLNRVFDRHGVLSGFWVWDARKVVGDVLTQLVLCHPKAVIGGRSLVNPYYVEPAELLRELGGDPPRER